MKKRKELTEEEFENIYTCQKCGKELKFDSWKEIKIIPYKYPLCFKCKNKIKPSESIFEFYFGENLLIFDEETKNLFETLIKNFEITIENGYLAIITEKGLKYFHREIFEDELEIIGKKYQIHHKNGNKLDNRRKNLEIIDKKEHYSLHEKERYSKAYTTWCEKVYGYCDDSHFEEFDRWLMKKGDIW